MESYYFLISAFPPLTLDAKPEITFKELQQLLVLNLTEQDLKAVQQLLRPIDFYNIRALWLGMPLDDRGNMDAATLEEELFAQEALPSYLAEFLERYEDPKDRLRYFSFLYACFYAEEKKGRFLRKYFRFDREVRLVLAALRGKQAGRDPAKEFQFEDPTDPLVAGILAQKEAPEYTPPPEYEDLKTLFVDNSSDPRKLERAMLQYRFDKIEEMEEAQDFGIDRVLAYIARLLIVESWFNLDKEQGMIALENLSQYG